MGALGKEIHDIFERPAQIHVDTLELEFSSLDLGEIQKIVDDAEQILAERCTVSAYLRCALVSPVSSNSSVIPRTPFIGVRISWLILARNELFAWFADSAASRARRSASSLRLCCVTSRATEMLPIHWLAWSSRGATAT